MERHKEKRQKQKNRILVRLFLSSPRDVNAEREKVREVVDNLERVWGNAFGVSINILEGKTHVLPQIGVKAQE